MPELISRLILLGLAIYFLWVWGLKRVPQVYLTWLGGIFIVLFILVAFFEPSNDAVSAVSDILLFPLTPLGLSIILLASVLRVGIKEIKGGGQILAALIILVVASLPIVSYTLVAQAQDTATVRRNQARLQEPVAAIVILGSSTKPTDPIYIADGPVSQAESGFGTSFLTRLTVGARLYNEQRQRGQPPFMVVSPGFQWVDTAAVEQNIRSILTSQGVPNAAILVDSDSQSLRSSAVRVGELLSAKGLKVDLLINDEEQINIIDREGQLFNIVLVAPALIMRRARLTFAQALSLTEQNVIPSATDFFGFQFRDELSLARLRDLIPNADALTLSTRVVEEYLIYMYYFLRGWLLNPLAY
ncbi:MAG: YdcF family protein [Synechococcales cyanobacterium T60_A2020_003]|nr:YdcF family protein [Synechococcales cyanobacterium T60_A2020_003]